MLRLPQAGRVPARNGAWQGCEAGWVRGSLTTPKAQRVVVPLGDLVVWRAGSIGIGRGCESSCDVLALLDPAKRSWQSCRSQPLGGGGFAFNVSHGETCVNPSQRWLSMHAQDVQFINLSTSFGTCPVLPGFCRRPLTLKLSARSHRIPRLQTVKPRHAFHLRLTCNCPPCFQDSRHVLAYSHCCMWHEP